MKFLKKLAERQNSFYSDLGVNIVAFGDSVTQGCFECYITEKGQVETVFEAKYGYHHILEDIFSTLYPNVPINYIYAGISGDNAHGGLIRLERDVLQYSPDLTVVSFGLNDSTRGEKGLEIYSDSLRQIFNKLRESGSEVIFLTENMMNTSVNHNEMKDTLASIAENTAAVQNSGMLTEYFNEAKRVAEECGVNVCDVYSKWQAMYDRGVDINHLLSNSINHPIRPMHSLFAYSLLDVLIG